MSSHHIRVGVLRGGPSNEYDVSLESGKEILSALRTHFSDQYHARDIFIDKQGNWHIDGVPHAPEQAITKIDVIFNALHGAYGEDGKIQHFLETHGIPFTGSGALGSAVGMNKVLTKNMFQAHGIKTPRWKEISAEEIINNTDEVVRMLFNSWHLPLIVKPVSSASSVGVSLVRSYAELPEALAAAVIHGNVLIEEYIPGIEATCGVIEDFRGHELYSLPPIEIRPYASFFDHVGKYNGKSEEIVPATFSIETKRELEDLARAIHRVLGLRHYSHSDFIIHPRRGIYVLEINTLPGLTSESLLPKALRAVGSGIHEFAQHLLSLANKAK
jgi:D-alanine-D-alanine ligase